MSKAQGIAKHQITSNMFSFGYWDFPGHWALVILQSPATVSAKIKLHGRANRLC